MSVETNIWLTGSHLKFQSQPSVALVDELNEVRRRGWKLLASKHLRPWPEYLDGQLIGEEWSAVYRAVLQALARLEGFTVTVSLKEKVNSQGKYRLQVGEKVWGYIYHTETGVCVASFTPEVHHANKPRTSILDWLGLDMWHESDGLPPPDILEQYIRPAAWREFFEQRMQQCLATGEQKSRAGSNAGIIPSEQAQSVHVALASLARNR